MCGLEGGREGERERGERRRRERGKEGEGEGGRGKEEWERGEGRREGERGREDEGVCIERGINGRSWLCMSCLIFCVTVCAQVRNLCSCVKVAEDFVSPEVSHVHVLQ